MSQHNLMMKGSEDSFQAAQTRTKYLHRSFLPNINAHGGVETFQTGSQSRKTEPVAGLAGSINLLRGGRDYLEERLRKENAALKSVELQKSSLSELTRARNLFVNILFFREIKGHYREALSNNKANLGMVQTRIDAGITTETDKLDFKINRNQLNQELAILDEEIEHSVDLLSVVLGLPASTKLQISDAIGHSDKDVDVALSFIASDHYDISILQRKRTLMDIKKKKANLWWTPSLDLYAHYSLYPFREREQTLIENRDEAVVGLQMKMNLFDGLQSQKEAKSFKYQSSAYRKIALQKERELEAHFRKLQHTLKLRRNLVHNMKKNVSQGRHYLSLTRGEYELGTKNSPDVLSASERLLVLNRRYSEVRRELLITKNELMELLGQ
jgi:outer membrane protein